MDTFIAAIALFFLAMLFCLMYMLFHECEKCHQSEPVYPVIVVTEQA